MVSSVQIHVISQNKSKYILETNHMYNRYWNLFVKPCITSKKILYAKQWHQQYQILFHQISLIYNYPLLNRVRNTWLHWKGIKQGLWLPTQSLNVKFMACFMIGTSGYSNMWLLWIYLSPSGGGWIFQISQNFWHSSSI